MAAGKEYGVPLNKDYDGVKVAAEYDEDLDKWVIYTKPADDGESNKMEFFGPTENDRPSADSVPVGAVYMAVNSGEIWQSNGSDWVVF